MNHMLPFISDDVRSAIALGLQIILGVVWLVAAFAKLRAPAATVESVRRLVGGPRAMGVVIAAALPVVEGVLGVFLLAAVQVRLVAVSSAALFLVFTAVMLSATVRHSVGAGGCGCFGAPREANGPDSRVAPRAVARNLVLAAVAIAIASQA